MLFLCASYIRTTESVINELSSISTPSNPEIFAGTYYEPTEGNELLVSFEEQTFTLGLCFVTSSDMSIETD